MLMPFSGVSVILQVFFLTNSYIKKGKNFQESYCFFVLFWNLKPLFFHLLSFAATRWITRCHSLPFVVTRCHSLYHSLSLIVTRFIARLSFYKRSCLNCKLKIRKWFKSNENRYFKIELKIRKKQFSFFVILLKSTFGWKLYICRLNQIYQIFL